LSWRNVTRSCILAQLQRPDVGRDAPAIARRNLRTVFRHDAEAVGHDVEEISDWRLAQTLDVIRRRTAESARGDKSITIPHASVTGRAIDIETFASACQDFGGRREGQIIARGVADLARIEIGVFVEIAARDRAVDRHAGRAIISEEIALRHGPVIRLNVHIDTASGGNGNQRHERGQNYSEVRNR